MKTFLKTCHNKRMYLEFCSFFEKLNLYYVLVLRQTLNGSQAKFFNRIFCTFSYKVNSFREEIFMQNMFLIIIFNNLEILEISVVNQTFRLQ
jgi:hypothetical protein